MAAYSPEDRQRQRRQKSEQAINLAMRSRWEEAAQVNKEILELFPTEVDALNRLGKALTELGHYDEARTAYAQAAKLDPANGIASKNIQRLSKMIEEGAVTHRPSSVDPRLFIEESGKTAVTELTDVRHTDAVSHLSAGDPLQFATRGSQIWVVDGNGQEVGRIEPKLEQDLLRLMKMGNAYSVLVTSVRGHVVNVIIRETHRSPQMGTRPSFRPSAAAESGFRSYTREGILRDMEDEDDEETELLEEEEEETETEPATADQDQVEETPLDVLAEAEEAEEAT